MWIRIRNTACLPVCVGRGELESVAMEEEGGASGGGTRSKKNDTTSDKSFSGAKFSIYDLQLTIISSMRSPFYTRDIDFC